MKMGPIHKYDQHVRKEVIWVQNPIPLVRVGWNPPFMDKEGTKRENDLLEPHVELMWSLES